MKTKKSTKPVKNINGLTVATKVKTVTKAKESKPKVKTLVINKKIIEAYDKKTKAYKLDRFSFDRLMANTVCLVQDVDRSLNSSTHLEIQDIVIQVKYRYGNGVKDMRLMVDGSHRNAWKRPKDGVHESACLFRPKR